MLSPIGWVSGLLLAAFALAVPGIANADVGASGDRRVAVGAGVVLGVGEEHGATEQIFPAVAASVYLRLGWEPPLPVPEPGTITRWGVSLTPELLIERMTGLGENATTALLGGGRVDLLVARSTGRGGAVWLAGRGGVSRDDGRWSGTAQAGIGGYYALTSAFRVQAEVGGEMISADGDLYLLLVSRFALALSL